MDDSVAADAKLADGEPALAGLAVASTLGSMPAGPALHRREPITLRGDRGLEVSKGLCAADRGFSLHAATTAGADDRAGKEALCKYILRPPVAQERVQLVADDLVRLTLKRPFSDGTTCSQCLLEPRWTRRGANRGRCATLQRFQAADGGIIQTEQARRAPASGLHE